jgi:hypothetical protein
MIGMILQVIWPHIVDKAPEAQPWTTNDASGAIQIAMENR